MKVHIQRDTKKNIYDRETKENKNHKSIIGTEYN